MAIPDDVIEAARVLNMRLHSATELGQRTQWIAEAIMAERERVKAEVAKALGDAAEAIFVMGAWSPKYEKLTPNTFDEGTSAAYEIVRELQGKAENALQSEEQ